MIYKYLSDMSESNQALSNENAIDSGTPDHVNDEPQQSSDINDAFNRFLQETQNVDDALRKMSGEMSEEEVARYKQLQDDALLAFQLQKDEIANAVIQPIINPYDNDIDNDTDGEISDDEYRVGIDNMMVNLWDFVDVDVLEYEDALALDDDLPLDVLTLDEINQIRATIYDKEKIGLDSSNTTFITCPITQREYQNGEQIKILNCNHCFLATYIDHSLLVTSANCPICKVRALPKESSLDE